MDLAKRLWEGDALEYVREMAARIDMTRTQLSQVVCEAFDFRDALGRLREMACRKVLAKMAAQGELLLPAPQRSIPARRAAAWVETCAIACRLAELGQVDLVDVTGDATLSPVWNGLMEAHHELGSGPLCGAQLRYLIRSEHFGWLGGLAFSAAARRLADREAWLGWSDDERREQLQHVACNSRFLISPGVRVPNLASHVLALAARRLRRDWPKRYGIALWALETFVAPPRRGTSYRAANWHEIGQTSGRGRQDSTHAAERATKRVFLHLLEPSRFPRAGPPARAQIDWAETEFTGLALDARLQRRTLALARRFHARPTASLPQACEGKLAELRGAYRLFQHKKVSMDTLLAPHYEATQARAAQEPLVLAVADSSALNYSAHPATEGLGLIGTTVNGPVGLWLHETLVFTPAGVPLGLIDVQHWQRDPAEHGRKRTRKKRPIEDKESGKWLKSFERIEAAQQACPQTRWVMVADRESDIYQLFAKARDATARLLVRAQTNRRLCSDEQTHLWSALAAAPVAGTLTVEIAAGNGRPARDATLTVRTRAVTLKPPCDQAQLGTMALYAVWAHEAHPPADSAALEWMLLTTVPTTTFDEACTIIQWYCRRWGIEIYHRTLKSGCHIEDRQLGTVKSLKACLAIDMVVAWRIFHLVHLSRQHPELPCTLYFDDDHWKALYCFVHRTPIVPETPPTLHQAAHMVARLGGFLGRKSDGEPGAQALWIGIQRLDDITNMYRVFATPPPQAP